jgi:hypothetical protein
LIRQEQVHRNQIDIMRWGWTSLDSDDEPNRA